MLAFYTQEATGNVKNQHKHTTVSAAVVTGNWSRDPLPVIGRGTLPRTSVVMATAGASTRSLVAAS